MANLLSKFGDQSETTYSEGTGLRYTDSYWGGETGPSARRTGFIPNTPISPIQMNTMFSQTTMCSYILGQVLASGTIKTKAGTSTINTDITSELTQDDARTNYADKLINFLNRINEISGSGNDGIGTESVWRSRQIGHDDTSNYWYCDLSGNFTTNSSNENGTITAPYINATSAISGTRAHFGTGGNNSMRLYVGGDAQISDELHVNGNATLGSGSSDSHTINGTLSVSSIADFDGVVNMNSMCRLYGQSYIGVPNNPSSADDPGPNVYIYSKYNVGGSMRNDYDMTNLVNAINDIGTRLDNLGFSTGSASVKGHSVSGSLSRQGNYVKCSIDTNITFSQSDITGMTVGSTLITLPTGFTPSQTLNNIILQIQYNSEDTFRLFICTLSSGSRNININIVTWGGAPLYQGTWRVRCNFGYEAQPR